MKIVKDTVNTFEGHIKKYRTGDYSKDFLSSDTDNDADKRITIEFDIDRIITPIVSLHGTLSMKTTSPKESCSGRFSDPDIVYFQVHIEPGHAPVSTYNVTGERINK